MHADLVGQQGQLLCGSITHHLVLILIDDLLQEIGVLQPSNGLDTNLRVRMLPPRYEKILKSHDGPPFPSIQRTMDDSRVSGRRQMTIEKRYPIN